MTDAPARILIVEDELLVASEIERTLTRLGYRIAGKARDAESALALLEKGTVDLALLDLNLHGPRDGVDLARLIRQRHHFPIVFLTAYCDRQTLDRLKDTRPDGYIVKPFNHGELLSAIELALHNFHSAAPPNGFPDRDRLNAALDEELTEREYDVLRLFDHGLTYREVGDRLCISTNTVKYYQKAIFQKMGVSSRHEALRTASTLGT
jgi:DNA-binding NarL/FixJ family response regulator